MKTYAQLITITEDMANKELVDALNKNFLELKESSENRDQVMLNAIGELQKDVASLKYNVDRIIDHLSGKKLLTEN